MLYAIDRGARTVDLATQFPARKLYQWVRRIEPGDALTQRTDLIQPLRITTGRTIRLHFVVTSDNHPVTSAYISYDGTVIAQQTIERSSTPGRRHRVDVALVAPGTATPPSKRGVLVVPVTHDGVVQVGVAFGDDQNLDTSELYEQRYFVGTASKDATRISVQRPALQYHLYRLGTEDWVPENVSARITERK